MPLHGSGPCSNDLADESQNDSSMRWRGGGASSRCVRA